MLLTLISFCLSLASSLGCSTLSEVFADRAPVESPEYDLPREVVWRESLRSVRESYEFAKTSAEEGTFETKWRTNLSPFGGLGYRRRVEGELVDRGGRQVVTITVRVETNTSPDAPLDPNRADWERADDDVTEATILIRRIDSTLGRMTSSVPR
jgi:hypothetical protein